MKKINIFRYALVLSVLTYSCDWIYKSGPCEISGPVIVYKTKHDYINNLTIRLSKDGKSVLAYPGKQDAINQKPLQLTDGYLFKRMVGDTYLSLTIDEYANSSHTFTEDDFIDLIIDNDPYLEKYECCSCIGPDTAEINNLIRNHSLKDCKNLQ